MIGALRALSRGAEGSTLPKSLTAFGIRGGGMMRIFSSHPPIEERIRRLEQGTALGA
jgi:heat shock protein HtpX